MERNEAILTDEACEEVISQLVEDDAEYVQASNFLVNEVYALIGEDEEKLSRINDAFVAYENAIVRPVYKVGYADALANNKPVAL
ncbi:hypothetical protein Alches_25830 [Alicyclobacillus hesperidum subsp. aegles]|uniref:hypothetical protein n=1 Tax=Alicyclobacillus TaxID=29330 RepID=UPI00118F0461|nr:MULTISPECIES: hypothetical protein [Alicyclobacillus]GEO27481.1 hypothetical protein AAC03nite_32660 [Alicyclobacillus acidoterrestris]GLG02542.1 hypothetical protein Alches_25830 [Alicyclobacillus hesperidum subsp. aegles]